MSTAPHRVPPMVCEVREAAERLAVSPQTVREWLRGGRLRGYQEGRVIRIDVSSIQEVLEGRPARPVRRIGRGRQ